MRRIGILGDIGSGKTFVANNFGYPVFNADNVVAKIYKSDKKVFDQLKKILPKFFKTFPLDKKFIVQAILENDSNLKKIVKIVHKEVRKKMNFFLKKNKKSEIIVLDIPLLLENKINKKNDILIFVKSKKKDILKNLKKRKNYNSLIIKRFKSIQMPNKKKKEKAKFVIENDFTKKTIKKNIKHILDKIL